MYIIERDSENEYGFTVVNTGEGAEYHPVYLGDYPKQKKRSAIRIGKIPAERIFDESFWYLCFKMRYECSSVHCPELLYDVLLPFLANEAQTYDAILSEKATSYTFAQNLDDEIRKDRCGDFETTQRSGTCFLRAVLASFRYCCKREGFSVIQRKQLMYALRICFLFKTSYDLNRLQNQIELKINEKLENINSNDIISKVQEGTEDIDDLIGGWQHSDVKMIQMALDVTALAAVKEAKRGSIDKNDLFEIRSFSNSIRKQIDLLGPGSGAPRSIQFSSNYDKKTSSYSAILSPFDECSFLTKEIDPIHVKGNQIEDIDSEFIEMNLKSSKIQSIFELNEILYSTIQKCQKLRVKSGESSHSIVMHQICAMIEELFTKLLPLPEPLQQSKENENQYIQPNLFWNPPSHNNDTIITNQFIEDLLCYFHEISLEYMAASYSLPQDRSIESIRIVIQFIILMCVDSCIRISSIEDSFFKNILHEKANKIFWFSTDGYEQKTSIKDAYSTMILILPQFTKSIQSIIAYFYESAPILLFPQKISYLFHWKGDTKRLRSQFRVEIEDPTLKFVNEILEKKNINEENLPKEDVMIQESSKGGFRKNNNIGRVKNPFLKSSNNSSKPNYETKDEENSKNRLSRRIKWYCAEKSWGSVCKSFVYIRNICFYSSLSLEPSQELFSSNEFLSKRQLFHPRQFLPSWKIKEVSSSFVQCGVSLCNEPQFKIALPRLKSPSEISRFVPPVSSAIPTKPHALALLFKGIAIQKPTPVTSNKATDAKAAQHVAEEDVFSTTKLPTFENIDYSDCENLVCLLTSPYISIPLIIGFFADHRIDCLLEIELQNILESIIFEPREYTSFSKSATSAPIPFEDRDDCLGDKLTLLERELIYTPDTTLHLLLVLLKGAFKLCTGNYTSEFASLMLYLSRITVRILRIRIEIENQFKNNEIQKSIEFDKIFKWIESKLMILFNKMINQSKKNKDMIWCVRYCVHQSLLIEILQIYKNDSSFMLHSYINSIGFVIVWHSQSKKFQEPKSTIIMPEKKSYDTNGDLQTDIQTFPPLNSIPTHEIFLLIERNRNKFINSIENLSNDDFQDLLYNLSQITLQSSVSKSDVFSSSSSSSVRNSNDSGWKPVFIHSKQLFGVYEHSSLGIEINLQSMEISFGKRLLMPTPSDILQDNDFQCVLYDTLDPYCVILSNYENCRSIKIFHNNFTYKIDAWSPLQLNSQIKLDSSFDNHPKGDAWPIFLTNKSKISSFVQNLKNKLDSSNNDKLIYNNEIYSSYQLGSQSKSSFLSWFFIQFDLLWNLQLSLHSSINYKIFLKNNFNDDENENDIIRKTVLLIYISPRSINVNHPGFFYEVVVLPQIRCFFIFSLIEKGRQIGKKLIFTSNNNWCFRYLKVSCEDRKLPWFTGTEYAAGNLLDSIVNEDGDYLPQIGFGSLSDIKLGSLLISRENQNTGINEIYIPSEFLLGNIPDAIIESFDFWKSKITNDNNQSIIINGYFKKIKQSSSSWKNLKEWWGENIIIQIEFLNNNYNDPIIRKKSIHNDHDHDKFVLLNPLHCKKDSCFFNLIKEFIQLESISHMLIWSQSQAFSNEQVHIDRIEFPRLGFRIEARKKLSNNNNGGDLITRFYSIDHDDLFLTQNLNNKRILNFTQSLIHGMILQNENQQFFLIVPNDGLNSVSIRSCPFSTILIADKEITSWKQENKSSSYYLYPIHPSGSFLMFSSMASALYMCMLRFLRRDYIEACNYLDHCSPDSEFNDEEKWILSHIKNTLQDYHPDAHACRLQIAILCLEHSPKSIHWNVEEDLSSYLQKYAHVSSDCRLTYDQERILLEHYKDRPDSNSTTKMRDLYLQSYEKIKNTNDCEKIDISQNMLYGGSRLRTLYIHADRTVKEQFESKRPCHLFFNYQRPANVDKKSGKPDIVKGMDAFNLLNHLWDDNLYGQKWKTGFFLLYEMILGRVHLQLLDDNISQTTLHKSSLHFVNDSEENDGELYNNDDIMIEDSNNSNSDSNNKQDDESSFPPPPPPPLPGHSNDSNSKFSDDFLKVYSSPIDDQIILHKMDENKMKLKDKNIWNINKKIQNQEGPRRKSPSFNLAKILIYALYFRFNVVGRGLPPDTSISFTILVITLAIMESDKKHKHFAWKLPYFPYTNLQPLMSEVRNNVRAELRQGFWGDRSNGKADEFEKCLTSVAVEYANSFAWKHQPMFLQTELEFPTYYCSSGNANVITVTPNWAPCRPHIDDISCSLRYLKSFNISEISNLPSTDINLNSLNLSNEDVQSFNTIPLQCLKLDEIISKQKNYFKPSYELSSKEDPLYKLHKQSYSKTTVANQILKRLDDDVQKFINQIDKNYISSFNHLNQNTIQLLEELLQNHPSSDDNNDKYSSTLSLLKHALDDLLILFQSFTKFTL